MKEILKNQNGFSLVELLVAFLIMSVIGAIALWLWGGVLNTMKASSDRETGRTIAKAVQTYISTTDDADLTMLSNTTPINSNDLIYSLCCEIEVNEPTPGNKTSTITLPTGYSGPSSGSKLSGRARAIDAPRIQACKIMPLLDSKSVKPQNGAYNGWSITIHKSHMTVECIPDSSGTNVVITP